MSLIRKVVLGPGIAWVDIPDADLRILCGCPVDAVKHLLRRGLILPMEVGGVACESGPNAILLSDVTLQAGRVCNLAEFPVLQMLYRQGMLVPGHPNNTGERPLLIGTRRQLDAQMAYIFRGNYGLSSREELLEAGLSGPLADETMRVKLAFAFGRIDPSENLVHPVPVGDGPAEIRRGIRIRRLRTNVFEIYSSTSRVEVDLNLAPGEVYACPYTLDSHLLRREYFSVVHSGEGDGWDMNRPTMGSVLFFQDRTYLVDAGPNIAASLTALGIGVNEIDGVFHTHSHDDHFAGLTELIRGDRRVPYYAVPVVRASAFRKLSAVLQLPESDLEALFQTHDLELDVWNDVDGLEVMPLLSPHPVETTNFRFRVAWEAGFRTYAHLADIASMRVLNELAGPDQATSGIPESLVTRTRDAYAEPANLKKIDIGGGPIHGEAVDFRHDTSRKIVLAHTARRLTEAERAIGSGAPFGTVDVLIEGRSDLYRDRAFSYLRDYFPDVPGYRIRHLLNCRIRIFNPESIIVREGEQVHHVYLVLGGAVEMLSAAVAGFNELTAGTLIGENSALLEIGSAETFRATSFVRVLCMPRDIFRDFVMRSALYRHIVQSRDKRDALRRADLFADGITCVSLDRIVRAADAVTLDTGTTMPLPRAEVYVLRSGLAELTDGHGFVERLGPGDHFGTGTLDLSRCDDAQIRIVEAAEAYRVPVDAIAGMPVVTWKLLEARQRRAAHRAG
jgi:hemerythrin